MLYEYARDNLLWLNVYVKDSFATHIVRDERMTRTSFVANVGGLLGLCMGFSLVIELSSILILVSLTSLLNNTCYQFRVLRIVFHET